MQNMLEKTKNQLNECKLKSLNLSRNNICLKNQINDQQRLLQCLSNNDIPRIHAILRTCLQQKMGVNSIVDTLQKAIERVYKCKSYSDKEIDVGVLVLSIGGPRLVFALNQLGIIPSKSIIHRAMREMEYHLHFCYKDSFELMIKKNVTNIISNDKELTMYSIKMDETAIESRCRYDIKSNEIQG